MSQPPVERVPAALLGDSSALAALLAQARPFVVTGGAGGGIPSLERFVEQYGDHEVRVSTRTFYLPFSTERCRVREYVARVTQPDQLRDDDPPIPYVFHDDLGQDAWRQRTGATDTSFDIARVCPLPAAFEQVWCGKRLAAIRIGLGPRFSHAGIHTHGAAVNLLSFGSKRWWLYPPAIGERQARRMLALMEGARSPSPQIFWFEHFHPLAVEGEGDIVGALRAKAEALAAEGRYVIPDSETWTEPFLAEDARGLELRQEAGDLVYVPERWPHAIVNDAWSLAVIYELVLERR